MIVYLATNKEHHKRYIGQTQDLTKRKSVHYAHSNNILHRQYHTYFCRCLRKYGWESWDWEILEDNISQDQIDDAEKSWIKFYRLFPHYEVVNLTDGGHGCYGHKHTDESKAKMSKVTKGRVCKEETKQKLSIVNKGKKLSKETCQKMSERKGELNPFYGKKHTDETKKKISESQKGKEGKNKGKKFNEEWCRHLSESHKEYYRKLKLEKSLDIGGE